MPKSHTHTCTHTCTHTKEVARLIGQRTTVVVKGPKDVISDGTRTIVCDTRGSPRRAGGQGDVLAGLLLTFKVWALVLKSPLRGGFM